MTSDDQTIRHFVTSPFEVKCSKYETRANLHAFDTLYIFPIKEISHVLYDYFIALSARSLKHWQSVYIFPLHLYRRAY